jgi:hypothetical protein
VNASSVTSVVTTSVRMAAISCERASPSERPKDGSLGVLFSWLYVNDVRASDSRHHPGDDAQPRLAAIQDYDLHSAFLIDLLRFCLCLR